MSADLTGANMTDDPYLWGFNTENIYCDPAIQGNFDCTDSESVYISLKNSFGGDFEGSFNTGGFAITTVPLPAGVWLFGSALGLLAWLRRRTS